MKKILNTFEIQYQNSVGLVVDFNPSIDQSQADKVRENRYLFGNKDLSEIKILSLRSDGNYVVKDLNWSDAKSELDRYWQSHLIKEWQDKANQEIKENKNQASKNDIKLNLLANSAKKFEQFLSLRKSKIAQKNDEIKEDFEFFNNLKIDKKAEFITSRVEKLEKNEKDLVQKVKSIPTKEEELSELAQEVARFKAEVQNLKIKNQELRKELELLIAKNEAENEKKKLEKENQSLVQKIEKMKEKTQEQIEDFEKTNLKSPQVVNKISYLKNQEMEQ